ncbi:32630_t:CDS:1, partial [Gigaspora margarita]
VIKSILIAQDKNKNIQNAIQKCDEYTINLEIPTRLRIVKLLAVRELLNY